MPLGTSVPHFSSHRVEDHPVSPPALGVLESLSHPRHQPPAQGCNRPATCGGRPSSCRAWAIHASPSPSSHSQFNHGPPCDQRTEGKQLLACPGAEEIYFRKRVVGVARQARRTQGQGPGMAFSESPHDCHVILQAHWEPRGPWHILSLPSASTSVQGLFEPVEAAQEASLAPLGQACRTLYVTYGGYGSPALVHPCMQHEPADSSTRPLLHPDIADSCSIRKMWRNSRAGLLLWGWSPPVPSLPADYQEIGKLSSHTGCSSTSSVLEPENHFEDVTFCFKGKRENFKQSPG